MGKQLIAIDVDTLHELVDEGLTVYQMAFRLKVGHTTIENFLIIYGLKTQRSFLRDKSKDDYKKSPKLCKYCHKPISFKNKRNIFCSISCSNSNRKRNLRCLCGNILPTNRKYCSIECQEKYTGYAKKEKISKWISGEWKGYGKDYNLSGTIRNYLLKQANHKCTKCNWNEINPVTGTSPLHIDHVDGDYRNNRPENLRVLCPNCHSITSTYGSLNRGNGRPYHVIKN